MTIARFLPLVVCLSASCFAQSPVTYTISTVAGNGTAGYSGDGGKAINAELSGCFGIAVDAAGNLYIADSANNVIRKVTTAGIISTVAGNATAGYAGDGAAATSAELDTPQGVALDSAGNLFIADSGNNVIRKVTAATGDISTVAGDGILGYLGDGAAATAAYLQTPAGVYVDASENILIADTGNNVVREVSAATGFISTIAGDSSATALGDGGAATSALLYNAEGVVKNSSGDLYIADGGDDRVRFVNTSGIISTVAGSAFPGFAGDGGSALNAELSGPKGIALDSAGDLFIADYFNNRIRRLAANGTISTVAGSAVQGFSGDGGSATAAELNYPTGVALSPSGVLYIADYGNNRIRMLTPVLPLPTVGTGGVINASGFGGSTSIAPGSWIEIYGTNLSTDTRNFTAADFTGVNAPTSLDGTSVSIGGLPAYVAYISPGHVNAQVPSGVALGTQPVTVTTLGGTSAAVTVNVNQAQPGMLATQPFDVGGTQYVAAILPDFTTFIAPPGSIAGITSIQAQPGETIVIYGIGFGPVTPNIPAGQTVTQANALTLPLQIFFGSTQATMTYSGLAPGAVGLYQFNVVVPSIPDSDAVPLTFTLNGVSGTQTLFTAVKSQ